MILRNLWILAKNDKSSFEKVSKPVFESFYIFFHGRKTENYLTRVLWLLRQNHEIYDFWKKRT